MTTVEEGSSAAVIEDGIAVIDEGIGVIGDGLVAVEESIAAVVSRNAAKPWVFLGVAGVLELALLAVSGAGQVQWPAAILTALLIVFALGQFVGWLLAAAGGIVVSMTALALAMPLLPHLHASLPVGITLLLAVLGAAAIVALWSRPEPLRVPGRDALRLGGLASIVPAAAGAYIIQFVVRHGSTQLSWAMNNDAVWNTMASRFIVHDGGLVPSIHPNPGPFANEIMAVAIAARRSAVVVPSLLLHDVAAEVGMWWVITLILCGMSALVLAVTVRRAGFVIQLLAALAGGAFPLTWYVAGFTFSLGFFNVTVSLVVLLAVWLVWREGRHQKLASLTILVFASTLMLAVWAPLASVPVALCIALVASMRGSARTLFQWRRAGICWLAAVVFVVYAFTLSIPDLLRDGSALGSTGAVVPITLRDLAICGAVLFTVFALAAFGMNQNWEFAGVVTIIVASSLTIGMLSRESAAIGGWGYYPAKMGWMLSIFAITISAASVAGWTSVLRGRVVASSVAVIAAVSIVFVLVLQVPPASPELRKVVPQLGVARPEPINSLAQGAQNLFKFSDPREKTLLVQYSPTAPDDEFADDWLLQQPAQLSSDPIRKFAYAINTESIPQVCETVRAWGGIVDIRTRNPRLSAEMQATCPGAGYRIIRS